MTLGARLNRVLFGLLLLASNTRAVDFSRVMVSLGTGRGSALPPDAGDSLVEEWAEFFRRAIDMAEADLAMERGEIPRPSAVRRGRVAAKDARARDRRITSAKVYRGRRPEFVAYVEGCTVETVERVRRAKGLDPATGLKPKPAERPITPPGEEQFRAYLKMKKESRN